MLHHYVPVYDHLRILGCLCYTTVVSKTSDKFAARSVNGVFLGYIYAKKGYKVLNFATIEFFVSKDVRFIVTIFPFKECDVTPPQSLFPNTSNNIIDALFTIIQRIVVPLITIFLNMSLVLRLKLLHLTPVLLIFKLCLLFLLPELKDKGMFQLNLVITLVYRLCTSQTLLLLTRYS